MNSRDFISNIGVVSGCTRKMSGNTPAQYGGRQRQYLSAGSDDFTSQYAKYASDFFAAQAQGLDPQDPTAWRTVRMRMSDLVNRSATLSRATDDYKQILIADRGITYIPAGTKFVTMGSTWICTNPENISSAHGTGVVVRCNAVWNHLDFYGNVVSEPIYVQQQLAKTSTPDAQNYLLITKGYYDVICQFNENTAQLGENSRLILGTSAYMITGFTDFIQEFTGDYDSVRLLQFTVRYEEPNAETDDMVNHVAGGKNFSWDIAITGTPTMTAGNESTFTASSKRCGETVRTSSEHEITYLWATSDANVAEIDENGAVKAVGTGECEITCTMAQNTEISGKMTVSVEEAPTEPTVKFLGTVPEELGMYTSTIIKAAYFENGAETQETVAWTVSGAAADSFKASKEGNELTVICYGGSMTPLTITAAFGDVSATAKIWLRGI